MGIRGKVSCDRPFADAGIEDGDVADDGRKRRASMGPPPRSDWEGPKFAFKYFRGTREIWNGPGKEHPCNGCPLLESEYCLICDRSGMDHAIPKPSRSDLRRRRRIYRPGDLKGGLG